ncbi:adenylate cyclase [Malassezia cuniculi]|uniref:Adenylate cyclase n=1 Tax=Malassezia cuniculi TaxID=948313 RepID=A0AAF0ETF3_9BASI|nr:adenylate cyclase [Malassezia cuniculi]
MVGGQAGPGTPSSPRDSRGIVDKNIEKAYDASEAIAPWQRDDDASSVTSERSKRTLQLNPLRLLRKPSRNSQAESSGESSGRRWWHKRRHPSRELVMSEISGALAHVHSLVPEPLRQAVSREPSGSRDAPEEGTVALDTNMDHIDDIVAPRLSEDSDRKRSSISGSTGMLRDSTHSHILQSPYDSIPAINTHNWSSPETSGEFRRADVSPKTQAIMAGTADVPSISDMPSSNWLAPDSWAVEGLDAGDGDHEGVPRAVYELQGNHNVFILDSPPVSTPSTRTSSLDTTDVSLFNRRLPRRVPRIEALFAPELATGHRRSTSTSNSTSNSNSNSGSTGAGTGTSIGIGIGSGGHADFDGEERSPHRTSIRSVGSGVAAATVGRLGLSRGPQPFRRFGRQRFSSSDATLSPQSARDDDDERCAITRRFRKRSEAPTEHIEPAESTDLSFGAEPTEQPTNLHYLRIYMADGTFLTIACSLDATVTDVSAVLSRRLSIHQDSRAYRLFVVEKGSDRPLDGDECPAKIKNRRLLQAGYTANDGLEELGREDLSCILRFVFRTDSVPTLTSTMLGEQRHRYEHLNLMDMHLEMVPVFVYRHADWIVSLDLSMNPLADLPLDFAQLCRNLRRLRLSALAFKQIPPAVCEIPSLTHLDMSSNRIHALSDTALAQLPHLDTLNLLNNRLTSLPVYLPQLHALQCINLSNNMLDAFPLILCRVPTLVDIDVSYNAISDIPPQIASLQNLERLILRGNFISRLPDEISKLEYLAEIDIGLNSLQSLGKLLEQPRMTRVYAPHNCLTTLDSQLCDRLSTLVLHHNPLSRAQLVASDAVGLTTLDLSHANLASLSPELFFHLSSLTQLVLDHNQFTSLPNNIGVLQRLESLSCAGNMLATLPDAIGELARLARLDVRDNNLRTLPAALWQCANLYSINASSNIMETLIPPPPDGGAAAAPLRSSLMALRVADNRLTDDVFSVLFLFSELEVVNLSMNDIYEIPPGALAPLGELRELYLSGNKLGSLPSDDIEALAELRVLFINGNRLQSLPAELGRLKQLHSLDVSNNQLKYNIANWHYDWNWNANTELRYLNLSGNQRFEIRPMIVRADGSDKNVADFGRLKNLRLLGLMEVTMTHQPLPDENETRRVRTTQQHINNMPYGIADTIGHHNAINLFDLVVPSYRKSDKEAVFGLFEGYGNASHAGGEIAHYLAEACAPSLAWELERSDPQLPSSEAAVESALRRTFLRLDRLYAEHLNPPAPGRVKNATSSVNRNMWKAGAGAVVAYLRGNTLHVANIGSCLAVLSRVGGLVNVLGTKHEPLNRAEFQRVRNAEGYVSLRGYVNDVMPMTRSFGHYSLSAIASAEPSVFSVQLHDADEFVILANSVFWEFVPYQMAIDLARMDRENPKRAAQRLRDTAIAFGAVDQVAVMVVTVAALFHEALDVRALNVRALNRGIAQSRKVARRARTDNDSTLARLDKEVIPPIGQVAIVFTDIKNSTLLWETNSGMQSAMRLHNQLLRRQLRSIGGYEVKTEGDAFMVSFQSVAAAVLWCFSVQIRLLSVDWPQEILDTEDGKVVHDADGNVIYRGLSVRMGIHWGWPVCEVDPVNTRMDYFGPMVNRAARISGAADGGQIMVSHDVIAELERLMSLYEDVDTTVSASHIHGAHAPAPLHPSVPAEIVFLRRLGVGIISIGERRLKGIETPEHLSLVYPKMLCGRFRFTPSINNDGSGMQMYEPTSQLIELGQLHLLAMLCLRLEILSTGNVFPGFAPTGNTSKHTLPAERSRIVSDRLARHPELVLGLSTRDDATDEELAVALYHLTTRICNCVTALAIRTELTAAQGSEVSQLLQSVRGLFEA